MRTTSKFVIDNKRCNKPFRKAFGRCHKHHPQVSHNGTSYLFLWFCLLHGYYYGCHVVPGSEGRKDPTASHYSQLIKLPHAIFHDFACTLHEYAPNHESRYNKDVCVFHYIFHVFSHTFTPIRTVRSYNTTSVQVRMLILSMFICDLMAQNQSHVAIFPY